LSISGYKNHRGTANASNGRGRSLRRTRATTSNIAGTAEERNKYFCSLIKKETRWYRHATGNIFGSKQQRVQLRNNSEQSWSFLSQEIFSCIPGALKEPDKKNCGAFLIASPRH